MKTGAKDNYSQDLNSFPISSAVPNQFIYNNQ